MVHLFFNKSDMGPGMGLAWGFPGGTLEKEVATQVSILAWEMPRTEEPGGPEPMRS